MNGFAKEGSKALGVALKVNQCLEELDISQNRISPDGALEIARALQTNSDLKIVKVKSIVLAQYTLIECEKTATSMHLHNIS